MRIPCLGTALLPSVWIWTAWLFQVARASTVGQRVLVVHDEAIKREEYSTYFSSLSAQGLQLSFRTAKQKTPALFSYDVAEFDHLLLFAPAAKTLDNDLSPQKLVEFLRQKGNILFALSSEVSEMYRDLAREFEIELEERGTTLVDHFASLRKNDEHTTVAVKSTSLNSRLEGIFGGVQSDLPFLYKGVAHRLGSNPLAFPILKAPSTSYSFEVPEDLSTIERLDNPDRETTLGSDADVALISAFQLLDTNRRNPDDGPKREGSAGRAVFSGSLEAFSNAFIDATNIQTRQGETFSGSSNLAVLSALTSWVTQQQGVLRVEGTTHSRNKMFKNDVRESYEELDVIDEENGERRLQRMYRIKDHVTFSLDLVQRTPAGGWGPAPRDLDIQVSLVMLDPYITSNLTAAQPQSNSENAGSAVLRVTKEDGTLSPRATRYSTTFQLPDRHGVYTFVVDWKRHGWSYVYTRDTSPVRPFNHDEHPRGLHSAWPYVAGATSTMLGFLAFVALWMVTQENEESEEEKQRKSE